MHLLFQITLSPGLVPLIINMKNLGLLKGTKSVLLFKLNFQFQILLDLTLFCMIKHQTKSYKRTLK